MVVQYIAWQPGVVLLFLALFTISIQALLPASSGPSVRVHAPLQGCRMTSQRSTKRHAASPIPSGTESQEGSPFRLGYVTDVEGNIDYFLRYVKRSQVLDLSQASPKGFSLSLREGCYFVYGGDAVDKGPGDIRLVRALVNLKKSHPDRVFLLVGNRDLNKLRFTAELGAADMAKPVSEIPPPFWDPKAPTLQTFLEDMRKSYANGKTTLTELNTRVNRLRYMLKHTLGCPQTFEFRREELGILRGKSTHEISDEDVLESFIHEIESPDGSLRQYIENANVAVCIGSTLFCHGAVDSATIKYVPQSRSMFEIPASKPAPGAMVDNVQDWTHALNSYLKAGIDDYAKRPQWNEDRSSRGGESLLALQNRPSMWGRSIVCNCYGDGGCITTESASQIRNDPHRLDMERTDPLVFEGISSDPMDKNVAEWLKKDGIQRVVVGHRPTGDCPAVLSSSYTGLEIVSADTSFSDTSADDNRGRAITVVEILGKSEVDNHLEVSGILQDGSEYSTRYARLHPNGTDDSVGDAMLGTMLGRDGWWIKASVEGSYYLTRGSGRKVEFKRIPKEGATRSSITK